MITHTHTHTETLHTHKQCNLRHSALSIQFQFQLLTDFDNLIERGLLFNTLNRFRLDSRCKLLLISFVYFQLSTLDSTWLATRDALSTWTTRRPLKTKRRYKCRLLGYRSKSKRSSQTIATNSNSNRESGGTAAACTGTQASKRHRTRTRTRTGDQTATYTMLGLWFESLLSPARDWLCLVVSELQQFSN